ncbi:putative Alpha/beta fold family hydrolase [Taphrina deformans PYCC 5710]|uniref:Alpha/beta fold family hydrolase n=1 Tax=Taphrina deformans (strain PYCC 5710 / ATCC 11124 / CBS 356.35 / IMI 108563 / JCM 9778 / NBRC 8474) TaxID=1097556 RepID=R4XCF3_TAPDE|nr:putative Alpha/beta fold family hydrolase [Taphrina deformans PYCC 5710]|eukprot:CCG83271.1 putative Alpha/beta fold family hydrolase [Taphrina deformans PYCC 5710]
MNLGTCKSRLDVIHSKTSTKLSTFVATLPSVVEGYVPLRWLLSWPHFSTLYSGVANFEKVDHVYYKRHLIEHEDGGSNALDFAVRTTKNLSEAEYESSGDLNLPPRTAYMTSDESKTIGSDTAGILAVLIHGIAGGSHENYIRRAVTAIHEQYKDDGEMSVVAFNARGCARSKVTSKAYWNAMQTDDIRSALVFLAEKYPNRRIVVVGFSLGANILCNYLARFNEDSKVALGIAVSNPWVLDRSSDNLESYWLGRLYSGRMTQGLQRLFKRHSQFLAQHEGVVVSDVMKARNLREFDDAFTAKAFGFESAMHYYRAASSARTVSAIRTNTILLNAQDDPMALNEVLPYEQVSHNNHLCLLATKNGGHIGWYGVDDQRWFIDIMMQSIGGMVDGRI